jgi:hypothetical protein
MKFRPQTEEEASASTRKVLPAGIYDAEVLLAEETRSKAGNDMMKIKLGVFRPSGSGQAWVWDYITETSFKLGQIMRASNMEKEYLEGQVEADELVGKCFKVTLAVEPARGDFEERNNVKRYGAAAPKNEAGSSDNEAEDDLPF